MATNQKIKEIRVGIFVLSFVALVLGLLIYVGIKKDLFSETITFYVISTTGENVDRGIPVRLSGFRIGQVTDIDLSTVGKVVIEIEILDQYRDWCREDATITLVQGGFIGQTYLKLNPGSDPQSPLLGEEATVALDKIGGFDEIIAEAKPVIQDMKIIVTNIKGITEMLLDDNGPIQVTLRNIEAMSIDMRSNEGLMGYLTRDKRPVKRIDSILAKADVTVGRLSKLMLTADKRVDDLGPVMDEAKGLVQDVRAFVAELDAIRASLQPAVDNASVITDDIRKATHDLARLRARTEYTLNLGTELLERLNTTWPLGSDAPKLPQDYPTP